MRAVHVALVAFVTASLAAPSAEAKRPRPPRPPATVAVVDIRAIHDQACPAVVEYATCSSLTVTVGAYGLTGWTARSGPAAGTVDYNSSYALSAAQWAQTVSHEVGGHHDAWHELVAKVGVNQAWADWSDLNTFAAPWMEARYVDTTSTARTFTTGEAKEMWLDCAGPVAHGHPGNYLSNRGIPAGDQPTFCRGHEVVMQEATQ